VKQANKQTKNHWSVFLVSYVYNLGHTSLSFLGSLKFDECLFLIINLFWEPVIKWPSFSINANGIWEQHITADGKVNYLMFHMKHLTTTSKGKGDVTNAFETKVLTNNFMLWFVTNFFVTAKCPYLWQNIKHDRKSKLKITILLRYWSKFTG